MNSKLKTEIEIDKIVSQAKIEKKKILFTNGCFDIVHLGHLELLREAKEMSDIVIVGLNDDNYLTKYKGHNRPINTLQYRIRYLELLPYVDYIVVFKTRTPLSLIKKIRPDILVKGRGYNIKNIVGAKEVFSYGGKVYALDFNLDISTTKIIEKLTK